ncbi:MAG TPA: cystathionine gamma-synthase [Verrucomicrobia bacterium]|nr:cystathionine gamma-synthase [Verrucomicrobiota bacterium]
MNSIPSPPIPAPKPSSFSPICQPRLATQAIHCGEARPEALHSMTTPLVLSSTFTFENTQALIDFMEHRVERTEEYGRYGNPTQRSTERKLAGLEGTETALLFSSGMAAVTTTLLALLQQGDHAVFTNDCYRKTRQFASTVLAKMGVAFTMAAPALDAIEAAIQPNTRLVFSESPTNPFMNVLDLQGLGAMGRRHHVCTIIDSTFATPCNQRPAEFGIDLIIHSATKYLGGHNDMLAGAVLGPAELIQAVKDYQGMLGCIPDPHSCYLLQRGIKTLPLRVRQINQSGLQLARYLEGHPRVRRVWYPGLPSHPNYALAHRQMSGFGGVVSFEIEGTLKDGGRLIDAMRIPQIAPSLGGTESLIEQPALISYYHAAPEERRKVGISDQLIRLSVGLEDPEDLIADFEQAFRSL